MLRVIPSFEFKFKFLYVQSSQVTDSSANKAEEKVTEARYSTHSLEEVAAMIRKTISVYEAKVVYFYFYIFYSLTFPVKLLFILERETPPYMYHNVVLNILFS